VKRPLRCTVTLQQLCSLLGLLPLLLLLPFMLLLPPSATAAHCVWSAGDMVLLLRWL
jgi:hypothetical protein